jgi:hypothetical protein
MLTLVPLLQQFALQPVQVTGLLAPPPITTQEITHSVTLALLPRMKELATQAAQAAVQREAAHTRLWLEERAVPKAVRVAQHEAYKILRQYGVLAEREAQVQAQLSVGSLCDNAPPAAEASSTPCTPEQLAHIAEICVTLHQLHGTTVDSLLENFCTEHAGPVDRDQLPYLRILVEDLLHRECGSRIPSIEPVCI